MKTYANENMFKCDYCAKSYKHVASMKDHVKSKHLNHIFECDHCEKTFTNRDGIRKHKLFKHGIEPEIRRNHIPIKETPKTFICICGVKFHEKSDLDTHMDMNHMSINCPMCNQKCENKCQLDIHMRIQHEGLQVTSINGHLTVTKCDTSSYKPPAKVSFTGEQAGNIVSNSKSVTENSLARIKEEPGAIHNGGKTGSEIIDESEESTIKLESVFSLKHVKQESQEIKGEMLEEVPKKKKRIISELYQCEMCVKLFVVKSEFLHHIRNVHDDKYFEFPTKIKMEFEKFTR